MSEPKPNIDYCHMINEQAKKLTTLRDEISKLKAELVKEREIANERLSMIVVLREKIKRIENGDNREL